jgi:hypothetical protein
MPKGETPTLKQERFIQAYLGSAKGNGAKAARMAGYAGNANTLKQVAAENLTRPYVRARIEGRLEEEHASNLEVVREITALAFAPIRFDAKGDLLSPGDQLRGKLKALELLGKVHQLFGDSSVKLKTPAELDAILAKEILRVNGRERGEALVRALGLRVNLEQLH